MPLMRGAILSPRHKLAAATPHKAEPAPANFFRLATTPLPMFGNDRYGDCVTAEEYTAKAADGFLGTNAEAISTADAWGGLNGADLSTILDYAAKGFPVGGRTLKDGPKQAVNYTDWPSLCSAIFAGQVKIAVAARQLERAGAGGSGVWFLLSAQIDNGIDHCVGLAGYGTLAECCNALGAQAPASADMAAKCVILETWGGYGIVAYDHALLPIMASTSTSGNSEAWLRVPTTIDPNPAPGPTPPPVPPTPPTPTPWHCPWSAGEIESVVHAAVRGAARAFRSLES